MAAPILQNPDPAPDATDVLRSGPYTWELVDPVLGVDDASVIIRLNGQAIWQNDGPTTGWTGTKTAITDGYRYTLRGQDPLPIQQFVQTKIYAEDLGATPMTEVYYFRTGARYYAVYDLFDDGTPPPTLSGNGSVTEVGGELIYTVNSGVDTNWYISGRSGVMPYRNFSKPAAGKVTLETEQTFWDGSDDYNNHGMWGFYQDNDNFIWSYADGPASSAPSFATYKVINDGWTFLTSYSGNPVTLPVKLRLIWDIGESSFTYQIYDAGAWQTITTQTITGFNPDRMFWYHKSWGGRAVSSKFSYGTILIEELPGVDTLIPGQSSFEDRHRFPTITGAQRHTFPIVGQGTPLQGREAFTPTHPSRSVPSAFEDGPLTLPEGGGYTRHSFPEVGSGVRAGDPLSNPQDQPSGPQNQNAFEDVLRYFFQAAPEFNKTTFDIDGRPHFYDIGFFAATYYNTAGEPWNTPTANNFTGYARNGKHYTNGVEDAGPVWAPWATEAAGDHRGARSDFPLSALIVVGRYEVVIFDLDSYVGAVTSLKVWMRFYWNDSDYMSLGRGEWNVRDVKMKNGTLVACSQYDSSPATNGGVFCIDFKSNSQDVFKLLRADGTWNANPGITIASRNQASPWNSLGGNWVDSEYFYRISLRTSGTNGLYVAVVGEDPQDPVIIYLEDNAPVKRFFPSGNARGEANLYDEFYKFILFDDEGWLWTSVDKKVFRHAWRYAGPRDEPIFQSDDDYLRKSVTLPHKVLSMVDARDRIYAGTEAGIYIIERSTMEFWLAYTAEQGFGRGRLNESGTGKLLLAEHSESYRLYAISMSTSSYLSIPQTYHRGGAVTVIRLYDDTVVAGFKYPTLTEDGAWFAVLTPYA